MTARSARTRVFATAIFGVAVGVVATSLIGPRLGILVGWDALAGIYLFFVWLEVWRLDAQSTKASAQYEDPTRAEADVMLLSAAIASLVAVGMVLAGAGRSSGVAQDVRVAFGLVSILLSWALVHTVYTLRYARLYYYGSDGGIAFGASGPPNYRDFAYLGFTIGMTYQVSDTAIEDADIRTTALHHALLSFVFGTGIIATTINLVASLSSG
jgi:uncharacterized membrane protein